MLVRFTGSRPKPLQYLPSMGAARTPLSERDAWEIATAWLAPLRGKVRLVVDRDGATQSIVERYVWVRIEPPDATHAWLTATNDLLARGNERASIMRAAMLVWTALSRCAGYSGHENAIFWKRVLSAFYSDHSITDVGERRAPSVTDAVAFFDRPDTAFPRFMVQVNDLYYSEPSRVDARIVLGLTGHDDLTPSTATMLTRILDQLEPFIIRSSKPHIVDVCVTVDTFLMSASVPSPYARLATFVEGVNGSRPSDLRTPRFQIVQFEEDAAKHTGNAIHQGSFYEFVRAVPIRVGHFALHQPMPDLTVGDRAMWAASFFQLDGGQVEVKSLSFFRHAIDDDMFDALLSALPFARSVESIAFNTLSFSRNGAFDRRDLPWIAYALFHPLAITSTCQQLELQHMIVTTHTSFVLTAMARGNNLLALQNGTPPMSDAYYSAELQVGTSFMHEPTSTSDALYHVSSSIRVDVCDVSSADTTSWDEWIAVIRPAYGLGWVRSSQAQSVHANPPSKVSLTSLRLKPGHNHQIPSKSLVPVIAALGTSLTYLNLGAYGQVDPATLIGVLRACPSLKGLVVRHSGAFWSDSSVNVPVDCPLEELELIVPGDVASICPPTCGFIISNLRRLRSLRFAVHQADLLKASQPVIERILATTPSLRYFHWRNASRRAKQFDPYDTTRACTRDLLGELQLSDSVYQCAQGAFTSDSAITFLSVVRAAQLDCDQKRTAGSLSPIARLTDFNMLATVFQFATSPALRTICIEPDNNKPPEKVDVTWLEWVHDGLKGIFAMYHKR